MRCMASLHRSRSSLKLRIRVARPLWLRLVLQIWVAPSRWLRLLLWIWGGSHSGTGLMCSLQSLHSFLSDGCI
uniref:Uncharacterized protein n=1 Tax=Kalanchoe fedtschenkoi TaxID=63787 RepID=A0A7N0UK81_KALFE